MSTKRIFYSILITILLAGMMLFDVQPSYAQDSSLDNQVTFAQLKIPDISLKGPLGADSIRFTLPADWQMNNGAELHLNWHIFSGEAGDTLPGSVSPVAGFLTVRVNDIWVGTVTLDHTGEYTSVISIPNETWITSPRNARQSIRFSLESAQSCDMIQAALGRGIFTGLDAVIHPSSFLVLPHQDAAIPLDLTLLPYPLYQRSFTADTAVLVMPQKPTEGELQAAITTASAMGNLTQNGLLLTYVTADELDPAILDNAHAIFVGKPASFPVLQEARWSVPPVDGSFSTKQIQADDGVLQLAVSPRNATKAWLLVSGNTDAGVIKAAQALGAGAILPGGTPDLAVVAGVTPQRHAITQADLTLKDLGYQDMTLSGFGHQSLFVQFEIPRDYVVSNGAYLDLMYSNSALLNFEEAAVTLELNGEFIGGLRFNDRSTNTATYRFEIPSSAFQDGTNSINLIASLSSATPCIPENDVWISMWNTSSLHIPLEPIASDGKTLQYDLALYPQKVFPLYENMTFVLADDPVSWKSAAQVAYHLGGYPRGSIINPSVVFPESLSSEMRDGNDLILVGKPSMLSTLQLLTPDMPAPFGKGSDIATEANPEVSFRVPPENPVGYLELFASPWNPGRMILLVAGNGPEGLGSAITALTEKDRVIYPPLSGNLVSIHGTQMISQQVTLHPQQNVEVAPTPVATQAPVEVAPKQAINIDLPTFGIALIVTVIILGIVFWVVSRNRRNKPGM